MFMAVLADLIADTPEHCQRLVLVTTVRILEGPVSQTLRA